MPDLRYFLLIACLVVIGTGQAAGDESELKSNPFLRPAYVMAAMPGAANPVERSVPMELRATIVAGSNSQANIGGLVLGLGDEVNGYRLVEVYQQRVVLDRDGVQKEIRIDDTNGEIN